jgi:class 3 adenylate cyclase/tetratricopeptide (TPR) repeat protein
MLCPQCQHENRDGARFCSECGAAFPIRCAACGAVAPPGSKYCDCCGEPFAAAAGNAPPGAATALQVRPHHTFSGVLTSAANEHELKQITVLFADIKGSTELVASLDADDARRLLDPILERMMEAVQIYEGTVNQLLGDGIMALFGVPIAYEDHALRASYCALRMQESIKKFVEAVRRTEGFPLQIRVGLNSGEVATQALAADLPMRYSVKGQTVHLAARMEQLAIPGTILMSSHTFELTKGFLATNALGPMVVKGLPAPVDTYELLGAKAVRTRLQVAAAQGLTHFVGRRSEIAQLRRACDRACAGHGQLVAIVGEAGVGKSRLVHEFVHSKSASACRILEVGAAYYGATTSYFLVTEFLRAFFQIAASDEPWAVREKVAKRILTLDERLLPTLPTLLDLLDLPQEDLPSPTDTPPQKQRSILEALKRLLVHESEVQPLLIILDDLHAADPETQALIDGLVDSLPTARILFVVSYRPDYSHSWGGKTYYSQIRVDPLNNTSAREMLGTLIGTVGGVDAVKRLLIEKTGGNPLFLEESVRTLVESGALAGDRGAYRVTKPISDLSVPATVESLLTARIDRLSRVDKRLLQAASVVGTRVPLTVLQAIVALPPDELRRALERLQAAELVYETSLFPDLEYTFRHALIHDVAYGSLSLERRRALHIAALNAGERLYADRVPERAEWLAFHASGGQEWARAVRYFRSAAARAVRRAASRIAVEHLKDALKAAEHLSGDERTSLEIDLRIELRHALTPLGQVQKNLDNLAAAEALAAKVGDLQRLGRIVSFTANCLFIRARHAEALATGERALAIARELRDGSLEIATRIYMARARLARGECRAAIQMLQEIIQALNEKDPDDFLDLPVLPAVFARSHLAAGLAETGDFEAAAMHAAEAGRCAAACGQPDSIMWGNWSAGLVAMVRGASEEAVRIFEGLRDLCRAHDLDAYASRTMAGLGCARARIGLVEGGLRLLERAVEMDAAAEPLTTRSFALNARAEALLLGGEHERALVAGTEALAFTREHEERSAEAYACFLLGLIHSGQGAESQIAEDHLRTAATIASDFGLRPLLAHCQLGFAELHRKRGEPEKAREYLERGRSAIAALGMKQWFALNH